VLDIGAGQGRHTLFLARKGYSVDAIDHSAVGLETIAKIAADENLPVVTHHIGSDDFMPENVSYSAVLLCGIIQENSRSHALQLIEKIDTWIAPDGYVFVTAFSVNDPSYERSVAECRQIGKNSFQRDDGRFRTYFEPDELPRLFHNFIVVQHREELGPIHQHGDDPPHRHAALIAIFRK